MRLICSKEVTDRDGDKYLIIFEFGELLHPLCVLDKETKEQLKEVLK
jgi:hypothetical protein